MKVFHELIFHPNTNLPICSLSEFDNVFFTALSIVSEYLVAMNANEHQNNEVIVKHNISTVCVSVSVLARVSCKGCGIRFTLVFEYQFGMFKKYLTATLSSSSMTH